MHPHGRAPEETVFHLPPVVPAQRLCRRPSTHRSQPTCQTARRKKTQAKWRAKNPDYGTAYRIQQRSAQAQAPEPLRVPPPLNQLPWDLAKDQFGSQGADFLGVMGALLLRCAKDQFSAHQLDSMRVPGALPPSAAQDQSPPAAY